MESPPAEKATGTVTRPPGCAGIFAEIVTPGASGADTAATAASKCPPLQNSIRPMAPRKRANARLRLVLFFGMKGNHTVFERSLVGVCLFDKTPKSPTRLQ